MGIKNFKLLISGFAILLAGAYIDNIRGPLLPVLRDVFGLNYSQAGTFIVMAYPFAITFALALNPLFNRFGIKSVAYAIFLMGLGTIFVPLVVTDYASLLGFGLLLGATTSTFGTLSNVMVLHATEPRVRTRMLCALHMMYGVGSFIAPVVFAEMIDAQIDWSYSFIVWPPLAILLSAYALNSAKLESSQEDPPQSLRMSKPQWLAIAAISFYVGAEVLTSMWVTTYMTDIKGVPLTEASYYASLFFLCLFLARLFGIFTVTQEREKFAYWLALILGLGALLLGHAGYLWGFGVSGVMGLFFPVFLGRVSQVFERQSRSLTVLVLVVMQLGLLGLHSVVGVLSDAIGMQYAFYIPVGMILLSMICVYRFSVWEKQIT